MNKKKSKALAFLLAASLLVPSANGIVSAAELEGSGVVVEEQAEGATGGDVVVEEQAEGTTGSDATTGGETTEAVNPLDVKSEEELGKALAEEGVTEIVITKGFAISKTINVNKEGITIKGADGVVLTGKQVFNISANATISNLKFNNTVKGAANFIEISAKNITAKIEKCEFDGEHLVRVITCDYSSKLEFIGNKVNVPTRSMIVGVTNGSKIVGNTIDLEGEHYPTGNRTGVLSVVAEGNGGDDTVTIEGNTFMNANRVIGLDNKKVLASNMNIKNNKFIDCRFAVEVAPNGNNKGQEYNLENNYFEFGGKVSALKVQDAGKRENNNDYAYSHEGESAELVLSKDDTIVNVYPYYSKLELDSTGNVIKSESVEQAAVKIGEKSYNSLEEAIDAINKDTTQSEFNVVLQRDIELGNIKINNKKGIEIASGKIVRITSPSKYKIELMGTDLINIAKGGALTLDNIELRANKDAINYIVQSGDLTIKNCNITATKNVKGITNIVKAGVDVTDVALTLKDSNITVNARGGFVAVGSGSEITGNTFNFINEEYQFIEGQRTGVISLIAKDENGKVNISNNTFMNANRAIGVDWSNMKGENLTIKNNKFIDTRYAFEVDSRIVKNNDKDKKPLNNKGKSYDLSGNYYVYNGEVGPLRIEDANASGSHLGENNPTELKIKDETPLNIVVGPYYTVKDENGNLSNPAHAGVATVNGKDYARLEKAIRAAKPGETVKLVSDITVDTWNQIWNIKDITIDGAKSETENYKITVNKIVESKENHDAVLHSAGGNTFKNLTIDLSKVNKGNAQGIRAIDAGANDTIDNVTIKGGPNVSYGITAGKGCEKVTVKNSNISDCGHGVYLEGAENENVEIKNNTFDACDYAAILYSKNSTFEGNTVKGGKVNIMHESNLVQKNTFMKDDKGNASRVKFYTEGNNKTYKYNKVEGVKAGEVGVTVAFDKKVNPENVDISLNNWGRGIPSKNDLMPGVSIDNNKFNNVLGDVFKNPEDVDKYLNEENTPSTPSIPSIPSKPSKPVYNHTKIEGLDRYETAAKVADKLGSYDTVVLVNATSTMSDGLSAAGLAGKEDAAILLVKKDSIPKVTMDRLKKVKKVYIIGGEAAISAKVANEITAAKIKVERLGGKTRVETSELVAKKLGKYKKAFVVNGFKGEADAMSASSVAAREEAPIILTNGKSSSMDKKSGVNYYVVGGKAVMDNAIVDKYNAERISGDDRYETNREMVDEFYGASKTLYFASGETLVDALTASTISKEDGLVLVGRNSDNKILNKKNTIQVGGMKFDVDFEK